MQLPEWFDFGLKIAGLVGGVLGAIGGGAVWLARHTLVTQDDLRERFEAHETDHKTLEQRLTDGDIRFNSIRSDISHLPNHQDLDDLKRRMGEVEGSVKTLAESIEGLKEVLKRIETPLNLLVKTHMKGE